MTLLLFRRRPASLTSMVSSSFLSRIGSFCSKASSVVDKANDASSETFASKNQSENILLSHLFRDERTHFNDYNIELVDDESWQVSSGLANAWRGLDREVAGKPAVEAFDEKNHGVFVSSFGGDPDFDEIDNMRIRGNLFYKLDRDSKEFEEYSFDFHRKKSSKRKEEMTGKEKKESLKKDGDCKEKKRKENLRCGSVSEAEKLPEIVVKGRVYKLLDNSGDAQRKKVRTPTFNQLTAPYHEPFCLDIYISKASVRACVVHRVTSKVVAVAHSISKDMKFDLGSTRNAAACSAVGRILAQRALADDIHNVVYTPRKGERLEGKLQIVLQSVIDNGVNVKVKLKQRKPQKANFPTAA